MRNDSESENAKYNRLIRCKHVKNWCDDTVNEFKEFVSKVDGLEVEIVEPFIKATFESQDVKDRTFELMADEFEWDGDNVNYFRRELDWDNISLKQYETYTGFRKGYDGRGDETTEHLYIGHNNLTWFPRFPNLTHLDIGHNLIQDISDLPHKLQWFCC